MTKAQLIDLAGEMLASGKSKRIALLQEIIDAGNVEKRGTWAYYAKRFQDWIAGKRGPAFSIFATGGNSKLPFYAFSSLPGFDCPGAGDCLFNDSGEFAKGFCYSFKAWRYPAAYFRQLQNSILIRENQDLLASEFAKIPTGKDGVRRVVRLYVDGDFHSLQGFSFWMDQIKSRPDLAVYGYSKSWKIILDYKGDLPANYYLNISSGSKYGQDMLEKVEQLPIARGQFVAVPVAREHIRNKAYQDKGNAGSREYRRDVLTMLREQNPSRKTFACPGNCGNCLPNGDHACGTNLMSNVIIGIGVHG